MKALVNVKIDFGDRSYPIGRLAHVEKKIWFEYEKSFLEKNINISPFKIKFQSGAQTCQNMLFERLFGVFNDSLPDGWGRLLIDRHLKKIGQIPQEVSPLERLLFVGKQGMGALVYEPAYGDTSKEIHKSLDELFEKTQEVLKGESSEILEELIRLNGSSQGARPKVLTFVSTDKKEINLNTYKQEKGFDPWIIKFSSINDLEDAGAIEYAYYLMAQDVGISMMESYLFPSKKGFGYFGSKRFDRDGSKRFHTHTACGLLEADFRVPSLDYMDLLKATWQLTKDYEEVEKLYKICVFNILAHNRDDHSKNFSYVMNEKGIWTLSPAYDLTFSYGPYGEHSTSILGEGKNPSIDHLKKIGERVSIKHVSQIIEKAQSIISDWKVYAQNAGVSKESIDLINNKIKSRS